MIGVVLDGSAEALLIGDKVFCDVPNDDSIQCNETMATVTNATEFRIETIDSGVTSPTPTLGINIDDSELTITALRNFTFGDFDVPTIKLTDLNWVSKAGQIVGFSITQNSIINFEDMDITFGNDFLTLDMSNTSASVQSFVNIALQVEHVPEPTSTVSLLAIGTLGLASALKRKQKQS